MALLDVILGYDCNLACDYCTITPEMRRRALSSRDVVRELREGRGAGYERVSFTGGEPTIRPDLLPLVRKARELGYEDIKVQSNGLLLAHQPNVERLVEAGCTRFHISIHTHDAVSYDALVRREDSHRLMRGGLENVVATGKRVIADVILKTDTAPRLVEALQWLHEQGVREAHLWFVSLTDNNRDNFASMPRMTDVVPTMHRAFDRAAELGMDVRSLHVPRCLLGDAYVDRALDPGAEQVRVVTPEATFELKDSKLTGTVHVPACRGCKHEDYCPGIRPDYLERYGDAEIAEARGQEATMGPKRGLPINPD